MSDWDIDSHKLDLHPARVAAWAGAKTSEERLGIYPIYVEVSPVGQCNHRCTFCAVDYIGYQIRRLETGRLCAALDNMAVCGVRSVMFAGEGEPMLHPDIADITNHAAAAGLDVAFTTNGTAMTPKFIDKALASCTWIKVSMNGGPKTYAKIHQTKDADYERVWGNLLGAVARRNQCSVRPTIGIQCVVLPENIGDLPALAQRARETGLDYIVLKPYSQHKSSQNTTHAGIKYGAYNDTIADLKKLSCEGFTVIARHQAMDDWDQGAHRYQRCLSTPVFWAYIMATGDVYTCSAYLLNDDFRMGNINDSSFEAIWQGPKRLAHIKDMETLDISRCRLNCRMNQVNKYLDRVASPGRHVNFI